MAQPLRDAVAVHTQPFLHGGDHMCARATFAGLPILGAAALFALGCADSVTSGHRPHPGPAFALAAVPVAGHTLYVPSGFSVNLFAEGLDGARSLALAPDGSVFVTLSWDGGDIARLVDADGDGVADARSTVLSGLSFPFGLAFRGDTMYFAEQTAGRRLAPGADCSSVEPPALTFQAHSAPLALAFYTGAMFPAEYRGDAFMTNHGSWDRTEATGANVVRVRVQNGRPTAVEDFVTGWELAD